MKTSFINLMITLSSDASKDKVCLTPLVPTEEYPIQSFHTPQHQLRKTSLEVLIPYLHPQMRNTCNWRIPIRLPVSKFLAAT
ncbi:hypothetical protein ACRRTK_010384 [Alexandromys fortis]